MFIVFHGICLLLEIKTREIFISVLVLEEGQLVLFAGWFDSVGVRCSFGFLKLEKELD